MAVSASNAIECVPSTNKYGLGSRTLRRALGTAAGISDFVCVCWIMCIASQLLSIDGDGIVATLHGRTDQ